ncbi:hypothetical protein GF318_04620 [Candidatus Micrarchaeota archaeon]|nr:hypothetical protein [Candidatus Micrarchaeota archaeon]
MSDYFVIEPCHTANGFEVKLKERTINLKKAEKAVDKVGMAMASSPVVMLAKVEDYSVSIYASGRILIKSHKKITEKDATYVAEKLVSSLEKEGALQ